MDQGQCILEQDGFLFRPEKQIRVVGRRLWEGMDVSNNSSHDVCTTHKSFKSVFQHIPCQTFSFTRCGESISSSDIIKVQLISWLRADTLFYRHEIPVFSDCAAWAYSGIFRQICKPGARFDITSGSPRSHHIRSQHSRLETYVFPSGTSFDNQRLLHLNWLLGGAGFLG